MPDKERKLYPNLVLAGTRSANGRYYPDDVLRKAVEDGLYDGIPIFLDHEERIQSLVGQVQKATWDNDRKCVRGDVLIFSSSPYAQVVEYIFMALGDSFGFSHVVEAEVEEGEDGERVKKINKVRSVDLVVDPATTRGIQGLQEKLRIAGERLRECCGDSGREEATARMIMQSYLDGELSFRQVASILASILGGADMAKKKENTEKDDEMKKKPKDMEAEEEVSSQEEEDMDTEEEAPEEEVADETLEEEGEDEDTESEGDEDGEEVKEEEEGEEEDEEGEELEEEDQEEESESEELEEEEEEGEEEEEEEGEVIEEEDEGTKKKKAKENPSLCERKLRRELSEAKCLIKKMVESRYLPTPKELGIIAKSKDPVAVYSILVEARKSKATSKPKTVTESRRMSQEDEWDKMIKEVRRRKGLIR